MEYLPIPMPLRGEVEVVRPLHVSYYKESIIGSLIIKCTSIEYPANYNLNSEELRIYIQRYIDEECHDIIAWNLEE